MWKIALQTIKRKRKSGAKEQIKKKKEKRQEQIKEGLILATCLIGCFVVSHWRINGSME